MWSVILSTYPLISLWAACVLIKMIDYTVSKSLWSVSKLIQTDSRLFICNNSCIEEMLIMYCVSGACCLIDQCGECMINAHCYLSLLACRMTNRGSYISLMWKKNWKIKLQWLNHVFYMACLLMLILNSNYRYITYQQIKLKKTVKVLRNLLKMKELEYKLSANSLVNKHAWYSHRSLIVERKYLLTFYVHAQGYVYLDVIHSCAKWDPVKSV